MLLQVRQEGDCFYSFNLDGTSTVIGRTEEVYQTMKEAADKACKKAEEYFNELVKAGLKTKPKTQEEINLELQEKLIELTKELKELKHEHCTVEKHSRTNRNKERQDEPGLEFDESNGPCE